MKYVYDDIDVIKYDLNHSSIEVFIKYSIIYTLIDIIFVTIKIINLFMFISLLILSIMNIISPISLIIAIIIYIIESCISKITKSTISFSHKNMLLKIVDDSISKYSNPDNLSKDDIEKIINDDLLPIMGLEFTGNKKEKNI